MFFAANPFISSYLQSDWFGKLIFWALFLTSLVVWTLLIQKSWLYQKVKKLSLEFKSQFSEKDPLSLQFSRPQKHFLLKIPHPFFEVYKTFKLHTLQCMDRGSHEEPLSENDLKILENRLKTLCLSQVRKLEKNLFVLSTVVTLSPFLGLLGTVWGILLTFSNLHAKGLALSNVSMLSGLSLALATTVLGLVIAIPALIGNNYLRTFSKEYRSELEEFSDLLISSIEMHQQKLSHAKKSPSFL